MHATTPMFVILCAALTVQATCKRGPSTASRPPAKKVADPDCPPEDVPEGVREVPVSTNIAELSSPDPRRRVIAAKYLRSYGCEAASAIPALARALKDPSEDVRYEAAMALGAIGPRASSAAPELINLLEKNPGGEWSDGDFVAQGLSYSTPYRGGRWKVAKALAALGPEAVRLTLTRIMREDYPADSEDIQRATQKALQTSWSTVVPALLGFLKERKDPELRRVSAIMLGGMDTTASSATPRLFEQMVQGLARALLEDPDAEVRVRSAYAFEALQKGADDETPVRRLISEGKEPMPTAVRALVKALGDPNANVRHAVVVALRYSYDEHKALVLPALERARNDPDEEVSSMARLELKSIREHEELKRKAREDSHGRELP